MDRSCSPSWDLHQIRRVDAELTRLSRCEAGLRLRIGDALEALYAQGGHHELGFSTRKAYALERLSRSGRWAMDTCTMVRRLSSLPRIRHALASGQIGWSMAELLSRQASPATERAWLRLAAGRTVHSMRAVIREATTAAEQDDGDDERSVLTVTVPSDEALELEAVRMVVEHLEGEPAGHDWVELLLAEGLCALVNERRERSPLETDEELDPEMLGDRGGIAWMWREANGIVPAGASSQVDVEDAPAPDGWGDEPLPSNVLGLDHALREMGRQLASRDLWLGEMIARFIAADGIRKLGYGSDTAYARERLGMSRSSMLGRAALARGTAPLEPVGRAVREGNIGTEVARLVTRIASPDTVEAWLERAEERTFKHLREEVRAAEMAARYEGWSPETTAPPDADRMTEYEALKRRILSGELLRERARDQAPPIQTSVPSGTRGRESDEVRRSGRADGRSDESRSREAPPSRRVPSPVTFRLRVRRDVHLFWRALEREHARLHGSGSFVRFLCQRFWDTWLPHLGHSDRWEELYRRDGYRCTTPVCFRQDCTCHHMRYGRDDPEDLITECRWCHLDGVHGGRLEVRPPASSPTWRLGRPAIVEVRGRDKRELC